MSVPTLERPGATPHPPPGPGGWTPEGMAPTGPRRAMSEAQIPMSVLAGLATLCTALCLGNLFDGLRWWLLPAAGAIVLAGLAGELGRRIHTPMAVMPLVYAAAGWLYVIPVAGRGSHQSISLVPSGATLRALRALADSGAHDIHVLAVPVPERPGFIFLTAAGVYLIASLVDAVAVGLALPAAAGLPLLTLLAVPAAVIERGVGVLPMLAACTAYIALLLASGRRGLRRWARLAPGSSGDQPGIRRVTGATGRRIGVVALVVAFAVPLLLPRYAGIAQHHRRGGGGGGSSATVIEPSITLAQQLHSDVTQPLLTVRTKTPEYLRLTALEKFDGTTFTLGPLTAGRGAQVSRGLPVATASRAQRIQATIAVKPVLHQRYLPVPYRATSIKVAGDWRLASRSYTIFSSQTDTSGAHYTVTSEVPSPTIVELRANSASGAVPPDVAPDTVVPGDLPLPVSELATRLTAGLTTEYDKVAAIQAYLRGPLFTYDLTGAPTGPNALADFLLRDRRGYCEQFAGAMVVLARQAGVPARVAIGFTPGQRQPDGSWLITNRDAHSWPEVWFPQAGWIRFEPTKRDESTTPPAYTLPPASAEPTPAPSATLSQGPSATPSAAPTRPDARHPTDQQPAGQAAAGGDGPGDALGWSAAALVALVLLLAPALLRRRRRGRRLGAAQPSDSWREIVDTAVDLGLELPPTLTPRRAVQQWSRYPDGQRRIPESAYRVLLAAARAEELARYAPSGAQPTDLPDGLRPALRALELSRGRRSRLAALLTPRSLLAGRTVSGPGRPSGAASARGPAR